MSRARTPGPWEIQRNLCDVVRPNGWLIASVTIRENLDLIASAPDLLAICEELEESAEYWSEYDVPLGIVDRLRAALAKARGQA